MASGGSNTQWRSTDVVAWTDHDGPGRPPRGPGTVLTTAIGVGLVCIFSAILYTDALCPEHRVWVQVLASTALVGTVVTGVGLLRGWATAPALSVLVTTCGMAIGVLDTAHAADRGVAITVAFGALWLGSVMLVYRAIRLLLWDRAMQRSLSAPVDHDRRTPVSPASPTGTPAPPADASRSRQSAAATTAHDSG